MPVPIEIDIHVQEFIVLRERIAVLETQMKALVEGLHANTKKLDRLLRIGFVLLGGLTVDVLIRLVATFNGAG